MELISRTAWELLQSNGDVQGLCTSTLEISDLTDNYLKLDSNYEGSSILNKYIKLGLLIRFRGVVALDVRTVYLIPNSDDFSKLFNPLKK